MARTSFALSALSFALALSACGGGDAPTTTAGAPTTATASASAPRGGSDLDAGGTGVVAKIGDKEISWAELETKSASKLVRLRVQAYDMRKAALDEMIDAELMEAEAGKRGISLEELTRAEVADKLVEPTDEEAKAYFDKNPPRGDVDFERIKPRVKAFMQRSQEQELQAAFVETLRANAGVQIFMEPLRFEVDQGEGNPVYGDWDSAVIQIVEFSEFQCPYCSRVNPTITQVKEEYGDKVAITFRDYPLPMHKEAGKASEAGHCANDQGKFWEMHDLMFANQRGLQVDKLKGYAVEAGLDAAVFDECLDSGKHADRVQANKVAGDAVGVSGTPAFFINGQFLNGAQPIENFKKIIDGELKAKGLL